MKRKLLSLLTINLLGLAVIAQTFHIDEDFNGGSLPTGWTNTANTGTDVWSFGIDGSVDHAGNQNFDGTNIAYFDDSNLGVGSLNDNASLESPAFNNASNIATFLEFDYNFRHFGANVPDSFYVEVFDGTSWNLVFSRTSDDCGNYLGAACANLPHARVNISAYANAACKVRFTYFDGNDWAWYVGLDNVEIFSPLANDIGVLRIESPNSACGLSAAETVTVKIFNYGGASQSNFPVSYTINNGTPVTETVTQTLASNDSITYTFTATANLATPAAYNFAAFTGLSTDGAAANDSTSAVIESFQSFTPSYNESFEQGLGGWTSYGANNSWNRGLPTATNINSAPNGNFIFATNTAGPYNNTEASYLESPCLDFTGGIADPIITFSLNYRTEQLFDRAWMEYSTDNGVTWNKLSASGNARNWYNNNANQVWTGTSRGWLGVENVLTGLNNQSQVKLRFAFASDGSTALEGVGIDNVSIRFPQAIDLGINELSYPVSAGTPECGFGIEPIIIEVENKGANTLNSYDIFYRVDNGAVVTETINTPLAPNTIISHTFTQTYDFSVVKNYDIDVWVNVTGDGFAPNDSNMNNTISNSSIGSRAITYRQNFDSWTVGTVFSNTDDAIGGGWTRETTTPATAFSQYLWRVGESNANRSGATGPNQDQNSNGNGGYFMYTEASGGGNGDVATLTSPCIDLALAQGARMSFWWYRYGTQITSPIRIDVYDGTQWFNDIDRVTPRTQTSGNDPWVYKEVDLNSYAGRKIKIRFSATSGGCCSGDMAIDNLQIWEPLPQDAQVNFVDRPLSGCNLSTGNVRVQLENFGTQIIQANTLDVSFQNNNGPVTTETVPFALPVGATATYTFTGSVNLSTSGSQTIKVWTDLLGDSNFSNDSTTYNVTNRSVKLPRFFYDFEAMETQDPEGETGVGDFLDGWTRSPNATGANYAWMVYDSTAKYFDGGPPPIVPTGPNGDHTFANSRGNGGGKYICTNTNDANPAVNWPAAILEFPCRPINFSGSVNGKVLLSFWYHLYGANSADLFVDVHNGTQWINGVGVVRGQGNAAQPTPQSEDTDLWLEHFVELDQFSTGPVASNLRIRFRGQYSKDPSTNQRTRGGDLCIDDVEILDRALVDGTVKRVVTPTDGCALAANEELEVEVMNYGLSDIIQLNMGYQVDFLPFGGGPREVGPVFTDVAPGILILPLARYTFKFRDRINMTRSGRYVIKVWTDQAGDGNSFNDTLVQIVVNETRPFPSCEDFSDLRVGMQAKQFLDEKLPNDWVGTTEAFTWTANDGSLGGPASGTTGGTNDLYMWVNTADGGPGQVAVIETPCFDLTGTPTAILSLDYAIFGAGADSMIVIDARRGGGAWSEGVDTIFPPQPPTNDWLPRRVVMTNFVGGFTQVRFRAFYAQPFPGIGGTYAIDNVCMITPPPQQLELEQILAPRQNLCFYSDSEPVRLRIQNIGSDRIDSFQVVVALDTTVPSPLTNPGNFFLDTVWVRILSNPFFNAGDKLDFTVPNVRLNMSRYTDYFLSIYILLEGDIDSLDNNEVYRFYTHAEPDTLILSDDFENVNLNPSFGPNFNNGYTRTGSNAYRWRIRRGPNRLGFTGPDNDHTLGQYGNNNGRYFVTDSRNGEFGDRSILSTECISFIGKDNPVLRFWYHMFGLDMGNLIVEFNDDSGWEEIHKVQGEQHTIHSEPWTETPIISLKKYAGKVGRLRFISERGGGDLSDMAIDNILIYNLAQRDIAVDRISRPNGWRNSCYTDTQSVHVQLRNFGTDSLDFTQESASIQVNIWKDGLPWDTLYKTVNTNIWLDRNDFTFKPIPQDEVAFVGMDGTFDMDHLDSEFIFETIVTMSSDTLLDNNVSSDTVIARRRGGRAVKLTTATEICGGSALNLRVQDYFGGLRWEYRTTKWDNTVSNWIPGVRFPFDSAEYTDFPKDTAVNKYEYRVKVCDIDTSLTTEINVYTPGAYPGLREERCFGDSLGISLGIDQQNQTVPAHIDYFKVYDDKDAFIPIDTVYPPNFLITKFGFKYDTTSTFWLEAIINDSCTSDKRTRTRLVVYPIPKIEWDLSKLEVVDFQGNPNLDVYGLCKDQTLVLDGGQRDTSNYQSTWTITYPDGSTQTRNTTSIFISGDSLIKGQLYKYQVTTYNTDPDPNNPSKWCDTTSHILNIRVTDSCITSLGELSIIKSLKVFPNPSTGLISVRVNDKMQSDARLTIRDMQGSIVLEENEVFTVNNTAQFDLGQLAKGVYFMKLQNDDGFVIRKIVLQ